MKLIFFISIYMFISIEISAQGQTSNGQKTSNIMNPGSVNKNGKIGSTKVLNKFGGEISLVAFTCGNVLIVGHRYSQGIAPVSKTVSYGTVTSSLSGASKCWITQNFGSDQQATSATDASDASAGWYWQFNRKNAYSNIAATTSPVWTITSISESSAWFAANDPCTLELGAGWRIPTQTEWSNADVFGGWNNYTQTYSSVFKLHASGYLNSSNGVLTNRGSNGYYWSSTQNNTTTGFGLYFKSNSSSVSSYNKAFGYSLRCIKD